MKKILILTLLLASALLVSSASAQLPTRCVGSYDAQGRYYPGLCDFEIPSGSTEPSAGPYAPYSGGAQVPWPFNDPFALGLLTAAFVVTIIAISRSKVQGRGPYFGPKGKGKPGPAKRAESKPYPRYETPPPPSQTYEIPPSPIKKGGKAIGGKGISKPKKKKSR